MTRIGTTSLKKYKCGDVILAQIQFTDSPEIKMRPGVVLYEEFDNYIVAGITSNIQMQGISLGEKDGAIKPSIIKLNYIFTISDILIKKKLFTLSKIKKKEVYNELSKRIQTLIE
jgi:hypothetical protein